MKKLIILISALGMISAQAAVNINWQTVGGGMLQWDAAGPTDFSAALDGGEIWQLIWAVDGVIDGIDSGMPSLPSGDDLILQQETGAGPTIGPFNQRYTQSLDGTALPESGTISAYVRVINDAPRGLVGGVTYFDPSVIGQGPTTGIPGFAIGGAEPANTIVDALLGETTQTMVMIPEPSSFALLGFGAFLLFIRRKKTEA